MLGINSKREPIRGEYAKLIRELMREYAKLIRELMRRVYSGQLNERDLEQIRRHKEILKQRQYIWK